MKCRGVGDVGFIGGFAGGSAGVEIVRPMLGSLETFRTFGSWIGISGGEGGKQADAIAMKCCGVGVGGFIGAFAGGRAGVEIVRPMPGAL